MLFAQEDKYKRPSQADVVMDSGLDASRRPGMTSIICGGVESNHNYHSGSRDRRQSSRQIPRIAAAHGLVHGDLGIERVEILGAIDAAQRIAAGRDQIALTGRVEAGAKFKRGEKLAVDR